MLWTPTTKTVLLISVPESGRAVYIIYSKEAAIERSRHVESAVQDIGNERSSYYSKERGSNEQT